MTDVNTTAKVLNLTPRRVQMLAAIPGCPAKIGPGDYDLRKLTLWYMRYLASELERRGSRAGPEAPEMQAARLTLLSAQVEAIEIQNAVVRGALLELDDVQVRWTRRVSNCKARLRSIPNGLGPVLTNKNLAFVTTRIAAAIEQALEELDDDPPADTDVPPYRVLRRRPRQ
jgi:phage terminase Nu1 subunit (DNA packaging protein)